MPDLPVPRQLPRDVTMFVNRNSEMGVLDQLWGDVGQLDSNGFGFVTIAGSPGVGKTALAVHWAHRVRHQFPDGELYVDFGGKQLSKTTLDEALDGCLRALSVLPDQIPPTVDARSALLRSVLTGKRVLIILDNVSSAADTRLFLPGSSGCLVVATSRRSLAGLVARDGAKRITLDTLSVEESVELLNKVVGENIFSVDSEVTRQLVGLSCQIPLTLRIIAERIARQPDRQLVEFVQEITNERARLDRFSSVDDEDIDVRAVFSSSYRELTAESARTFRLLALHPGLILSASAAGALLNIDLRSARNRLENLASVHLIQSQGYDRYGFHDLLREYAAERVRDDEPVEERLAAHRRMFQWYFRSLQAACRTILPNFHELPLEVADSSFEFCEFGDSASAWAWFEEERVNLVSAIRESTRLNELEIAWHISAMIYPLLELHQHWKQWLEVSKAGVIAAQHAGNAYGEGCNHLGLGDAQWLLQERQAALNSYREALRLGRKCRDGWLEGFSLRQIGVVLLELGRDSEAIASLNEARRVFQRIDERRGDGMVLLSLAAADRSAGKFAASLSRSEDALRVLSQTDDQWSIAWARCAVGQALLDLDDAPRAAEQYFRAYTSFKEIDNKRNEGRALLGMGIAAKRMGREQESLEFLSKVDEIVKDLKDPSLVAEIQEMMEQLDR
ncbi:ATP-binding protein [Actinokineospora spheciospongiae]|uniref:ATP-binding protein n=1 Tax=Actinokineospora spheciospongiae TaxID=909613 RepID=UPI000D71A3DB|nr:tetratricopeptide repeat protein [Actinokineospora spheciospongiae]PWW60466.1 NB-ARC domain-containing protein [Actinokineospora spheciospongiae]